MNVSADHVREILKLVDEHAVKGDLSLSRVKDLETLLSFKPTPVEADFLRGYTVWRLKHSVAGITQP